MKNLRQKATWCLILIFSGNQECYSQDAAQPAENRKPLPAVSVELHEASLQDVCAALSKSTGVAFAIGRNSQPGTFSLAAKDRPYWEVFEELSKQHALAYRPSMNGIELRVQNENAVMQVHGPVLLQVCVNTPDQLFPQRGARTLESVIARPVATGLGAEPPPPEGTQYILTLAVIADPRLIAMRDHLDLKEVLDEKAQPIEVLGVSTPRLGLMASTGPWSAHPGDYERINYWIWSIALAAPKNASNTIAQVKGVIHLQASGKDEIVKLDDVETRHQQELVPIGKEAFTLKSANLRDGRYLNLQYRVDANAAANEGSTPLEIRLLNANDEPLIWTREPKATASRSISINDNPRAPSPFPFKPPFSVVLRAPQRMGLLQIPFEFKALPLP